MSLAPIRDVVEKLANGCPEARLLDRQQPVPRFVQLTELLNVPDLPLHSAVLSNLVHSIPGRLLADDVADAPPPDPTARLHHADETIDGLDADSVFDLSDVNPHLQHRRCHERPPALTLEELLEEGRQLFFARINHLAVEQLRQILPLLFVRDEDQDFVAHIPVLSFDALQRVAYRFVSIFLRSIVHSPIADVAAIAVPSDNAVEVRDAKLRVEQV